MRNDHSLTLIIPNPYRTWKKEPDNSMFEYCADLGLWCFMFVACVYGLLLNAARFFKYLVLCLKESHML